GSQTEMRSFAQDSQSYAARNPAMGFLNGWVALDSADALADQGRWNEAIDSYTQAIKLGGEYWTAYRRRANAYYAMQRWYEAIADGRQAEVLFPQNSEVLRLLAMANAQNHNPVDSIGWLTLLFQFEGLDATTGQLVASNRQELIDQHKGNAKT